MWKYSKFFKDKVWVEGNWNFKNANSFPKRKYLGADTETKLYYNGKLLSEDEAYNLYRNNGQAFVKQNVEVVAYAFMLSDGENFALFQNCEDFITACAMFQVDVVFWYNARFDFSIFDYYLLTNGWEDTTTKIKDKKNYGKLPSKTYQSLNGEYGQRYELKLWYDYYNKHSERHVHHWTNIDICNIYGGGLKKNLEDFKIKDKNGNDVRKLEMDYVEADIEDDIQYMINDTKGLYLLAEKINETLLKITGFSLFKGDFITAGGLAKKTLLKFLFESTPKQNIKIFKQCFPVSAEDDKKFRFQHLYLGGKCFVNPYKKGVVQKNIYKYDVNSMYPNQMRNMTYPYGKPNILMNDKKLDNKHCYIYYIKKLRGVLKHNKVPVWQDVLSGEYTDIIREDECRYIWKEELDEIIEWYDLEYELIYILEYVSKVPKGVKKYVDTFYDIKCNNKGSIKQGAKLLLNSAYGKLAQKIERYTCVYSLNEDGIVHLERQDLELDEAGMLSVVVGSRITALARVDLMQFIREICKGDVKNNFIYCDTDSVHSLTPYEKCDDKELGKMKCEGIFEYGLYLAPKSYLMYNDGEYEVHCKGVNTEVVKKEIEKCNSFSEACDIFKPNRLFKCLCGLNVKGGKALIYVDKMIVNDENFRINKEVLGDLEDVDECY